MYDTQTPIHIQKQTIIPLLENKTKKQKSQGICTKPGVSNTRPATSLKLLKSLLRLLCSFSLQLWPAETFFLLMRPASPFFVKMWPAYETEFETPVLSVPGIPGYEWVPARIGHFKIDEIFFSQYHCPIKNRHSLVTLFSVSWSQFHQRFFVRKCFLYESAFCRQDVTREKHFHTKNARKKWWWNWLQVSISSTFYEQLLRP